MVNTVKKNERKAETGPDHELERAVGLYALGVTADLVSQGKLPVNEIPGMVDAIAAAFMKSHTVGQSMAALNSSAAMVVTQTANENKVEPAASGAKRGRGRPKKIVAPALDGSAETVKEIPVAETIDETPVKRGRGRPKKIVAVKPVEQAEQIEAQTVVETGPAEQVQVTQPTNIVELLTAVPMKRGRGRPRKQFIRYVPSADPTERAKLDKAFRKHYPAKISEKVSLNDIGDGKMTCLIDGKRVSFLKKYLETRYGMSFDDYKRIYKLSEDYPATPPKFHQEKQQKALAIGLGRKKDVTPEAQPRETTAGQSSEKATPRKRNSRVIEVQETAAA